MCSSDLLRGLLRLIRWIALLLRGLGVRDAPEAEREGGEYERAAKRRRVHSSVLRFGLTIHCRAALAPTDAVRPSARALLKAGAAALRARRSGSTSAVAISALISSASGASSATGRS